MASDSGLMRLWRHSIDHRRQMLWAASASVLNKLFDLAPPVLIGTAVDIVVRREASVLGDLGVVDTRNQLMVLALVTFIVWGLESLFEFALKVAWRNLAQQIQHELRLQSFAHLQGLDLDFFETRRTGDLMAVLNDDVNQLERFLDVGANEVLQVATTVTVIGAVFFWLAPTVAWMAFAPIPFIIWGSLVFQRKIAPRYARVRVEVARLNSHLEGALGGIATIKAFAAEERELERLSRLSQAYQEANRRAIRLSSAFSPLIRIVILVGFTATLLFGGLLTLDGHLEVGAYSVMVFFTQRLLWPLTRLGTTVDLYQRAMSSTQRIFDLLAVDHELCDGEIHVDGGELTGALRLEGVHFAYPTREPVFAGLDLDIPAGKTTAIVGSTGAGKSTLVKLLLRFHDPSAGKITLDGYELSTLQLADLRQAVGLVAQDVFLFPGSVAENIAYGRPQASHAEIVEAARVADALGFVEELPEKWETLIGERGRRLSGGQRQRISLARAVLLDPPILVLDEATSSVDNETEAAIQASLERIGCGRTMVVIAHRLSTVRNADRIHVLERGQIVEAGTHEELVAADGIYAQLWRVQTGERRP